jgi:acyl-CoA synthetase (AMP-forming)/AMP-acid ligase II
MRGLMQDAQLMISSILTFAARHHGRAEIVSKFGERGIHRYTYAEAECRARRLVRVLQRLGVKPGDRVGTMAWNGYRHFELYFAVPGMQAICHTINPRLSPDDIAYMIGHAEDKVLFVEAEFVPLLDKLSSKLKGVVKDIVVLQEATSSPPALPAAGIRIHSYEGLVAAADDDYVWPTFDENAGAALCYTSGTTGRPKGVLYSHRSTVLHSYAINMADVFAFRAVDRVMPVVPMFHANGWGTPHAAAMVGSSLVLPGRDLDGANLEWLMNSEQVTFAAGVPSIWLGLLHYLRSSAKRLETMQRIVVGGSACPPLLIEAFEREYGIQVKPAWGMTEISPVGGCNQATPSSRKLSGNELLKQRTKQGRCLYGIDMKIVDADGIELPWDGKSFGNLLMRGPWVASGYYRTTDSNPVNADGWLFTGDVSTIDPDGFMEIVDRSKDLIKSGGEWISSIALENIAVSHSDVLEAAIVAASHPQWGERPLLVVALKEGKALDKAGILALYRNRVPKWWMPDDVIALEALPHTATGKLKKLALRDRFREHLIATGPDGVNGGA